MKFHIYRDENKEYRWRLKANNGRIIANSGEGYKRRRGCIEVFRKLIDAHLTMSLTEERK